MSLIFQSILKRYTSRRYHQISLDKPCCLKYKKHIQTGESKQCLVFFPFYTSYDVFFLQNRTNIDHVLYITFCVHSFCSEVLSNFSFMEHFLTISCKDLSFLSIIPFCCGVLKEENLGNIPCFSQKFSEGSFSNSPP